MLKIMVDNFQSILEINLAALDCPFWLRSFWIYSLPINALTSCARVCHIQVLSYHASAAEEETRALQVTAVNYSFSLYHTEMCHSLLFLSVQETNNCIYNCWKTADTHHTYIRQYSHRYDVKHVSISLGEG